MPTRPFATKVIQKLVDAGFIAYFAGGWVRDYLMKHPSDDIDIATSASVDEIRALFPKTIPVGVAFGIVIVVQDGHHFEVATFRKDRGYVDGRRPSGIDPATPEEDAERRDFTINGMFFDPLTNTLYDYVGGQRDIEKKLIRAIGDPHARFSEDRLRMMRAVRYCTRFDFTIDPDTLQAIKAHAESLLPAVAMERIWQEFKKMSQFAHFDRGLLILHRLHLLQTIFPALKNVPIEEIEARLCFIAHFPKKAPAIAELLELFPNSSLEELLQLCEYLKLSREDREFVTTLHHARHLLSLPEGWRKDLEPIEWAQFYANRYAEICLEIAVARAPVKQKESMLLEHRQRKDLLHDAVRRIQTKQPIVRSDDLLKEGITPGVKMGKLLIEAERLSVNQNIVNKEEILQQLKRSALW